LTCFTGVECVAANNNKEKVHVMKKFLALMLCFSLLSFFLMNEAFAQSYHENDKEGLRAFLRQSSTESNVPNFTYFGLTVADTATWKSSEIWVEKMNTSISPILLDWEWNFEFPSRLVRFDIKTMYKYLNSENGQLSGVLDCSPFSELVYLDCSGSKLTSLNVSANPQLKELRCSGNNLVELLLSSNPKLVLLDCSDNNIQSLDVSGNTMLSNLDCSRNNIAKLDVSGNTLLNTLSCSDNNINTLDLSENVELKLLSCANNELNNLDLEQNTNIVSLYCSGNNLEGLDIASVAGLEALDCSGNKLSSLNVSSNTALKYLSCADNKLSNGINLAQNTNLVSLNFSGNLSGIDIEQNTNLEHFYCSGNELTTLDVSENVNLISLDCSYNDLKTLDLSSNKYLSDLNCAFNQLSEVKINTDEILYRSLICNDNDLRLSTLPICQYSYYKVLTYSPQNVIDGGELYASDPIDLSGEYSVRNIETLYYWTEKGNESNICDLTHEGVGIFYAGNTYKDMTLECKMTNAVYPDLSLVYHVKVKEDTVVGIGDGEYVQGRRIYPNPVKDDLYINISEDVKSVDIYSTTGVLVLTVNNYRSGESIPVSDLPSGMYVVKVATLSGKSLIEKIKKN